MNEQTTTELVQNKGRKLSAAKLSRGNGKLHGNKVRKNTEPVSVVQTDAEFFEDHREPIHGAADVKPEGIAVGFSIFSEGNDGLERSPFWVKIDNNRREKIDIVPETTSIQLKKRSYLINNTADLPLISDRWGVKELLNFKKNPVSPVDIFKDIKGVLQSYLDLPSPALYGLLALWVISTYLSFLFNASVFLLFLGPKESGKSKALEMVANMAFNAVKLKNVTEAALCDTTDGRRGTVLLDQAESIPRNMVGILADSYKRAGAKRRIIGSRNGKRAVMEYSGYGPKAFASTRDIDPDLADRCLMIRMLRSSAPLPEFFGNEDAWLSVRDQCYRFMFMRHKEVRDAYHAIKAESTRKGELWRSLEAISKVLGLDDSEFREIKMVFDECIGETKSTLSPAEQALFEVLLKRADAAKGKTFASTAKGLLGAMLNRLDDCDHQTPQWLGVKIALYGLADETKKKTRRKLVHYTFSKDKVVNIVGRYIQIKRSTGNIKKRKTVSS